MNIFSYLVSFFKRDPPKSNLQMLSIPTAQISSWSGAAYENDIYRAAIDAIARNAAKLKPVHTITDPVSKEKKPADKQAKQTLQKILQVSPNPYMTTYDLLYKLTTQYYLYNNAFALLDWTEGGRLAGIYPVNFVSVNFAMDGSGSLYCEFTFKNGRKAQFSYNDLIHIRRHFNSNEFLGDDNAALNPALELAHTQNEGIVAGIKNSGNLRGILKLSQLSKAADAKETRKQFIKDFLNLSNTGGIAVLDPSADFVPLNSPPQPLDTGQIQAVKEKIYSYLGINEKIVNSSYSEDDFSAFYESVIEPLATQLSLEFTRKIFSEREIAFGNQIIFESGRLQFSSNKTKIELIKELTPLGLLSINQALEILNLAPVEGGDRRLQTLNVVDFGKATEYQLAKANAESNINKKGDKKNGVQASTNNSDTSTAKS
jgi:HK97 family phage portal protein